MTPERWRRITGVFHDALGRDAVVRGAFLDEACAGDNTLRAELDAMLAAHHAAGAFGEAPILGPANQRREAPRAADAPTPSSAAAPLPGKPHPFVWFLRFAVLLTVAVFAYAAWLLATRGGDTTSFGWSEVQRRDGWYVASVDPAGPAAAALRAGDRVIGLDGRPPAPGVGTRFQRRALDAQDTYRLAIERDGHAYTTPLVVAAGESALTERLINFVVGLVWCAVALFIGVARPEQPLARLACLSAVVTGLLYIQIGVIDRPPGVLTPLHAIVGFHFFCRFPTGEATTGRWRAALLALYAVAGMTAALNLWLTWTILTQGTAHVAELAARHPELMPLRSRLFMVAYWGALVGIVAVVARNYRRVTDEDQRRRVRWVVYGCLVALAPQFWWAAVTLYESFVGPAAIPGFSFPGDAFTIVIPITVAYAVVKHRVLDIKVVVRRGLQYLLARRALQALVALPIAALAYAALIHRHRTIAQLVGGSTAYLYWAAAAALALRFRDPMGRWLDRRFFREEHDREQVLLGLLGDLGSVESMSELSRRVCAELESVLHPKVVGLWHRDPDALALAYSSGPLAGASEFPAGGRLVPWLEERGCATALPLPSDAGFSNEEVRWLSEVGADLLVPIRDSSDRLVGVLLLGEKKSEEPYQANDRQLLQAVAQQTAVMRENLRLRAQVNDEQRIRHDVLARLDGNLDLLKECPACGACFDSSAKRCDRDGMLLTLSMPVGRTFDAKYRLDQLIGKGGMGAVYEARDLRLDRPVAVKIILPRAFGQRRPLRRFHREARAAARLNHPNIVSVYDVGSLDREGGYLVMERVYGVTLRAELDNIGVMPPSAAAEWFDPLLSGTAAAHAQGIVHRDLKPENVIGRRQDSRLVMVKILDFGLAKFRAGEAVLSGTGTADGVVMGTLGYMSPEQLVGGDVDQGTDIFAVGVMLVEALTGQKPFRGDTYTELLRAVLQDVYHLPCSTPEQHAVDALLQRCLASKPRDRWTSAEELRKALIPALRRCPPFG